MRSFSTLPPYSVDQTYIITSFPQDSTRSRAHNLYILLYTVMCMQVRVNGQFHYNNDRDKTVVLCKRCKRLRNDSEEGLMLAHRNVLVDSFRLPGWIMTLF